MTTFPHTAYDIPGVGALSTHAGFNICTYTGAKTGPGDVERLASVSGIAPARMVFPRQTHSANVAVIEELPVAELDEVDAVVTRLGGVLLGVNTADCVPLLLADAKSGVIAACHCGWRGVVAGIAAKTLRAMTDLGADPGNVCGVIGPHICVRCFEVGEEVAGLFAPEVVDRRPGFAPHVDLAKAVELQLPGVAIRRSGLCSKELPQFYSVRRSGRAETRRTLSAIWR